MDLWVREARVFKYGSGTGSNFSDIRGENERLSGGGRSSGLMSFLKIGDRAAGAIKSGGTTRRAAKMVTLDLDHPDIQRYVRWKAVEETEGGRARGGVADALRAPEQRRRGDHRGRRRGRRAVRRADQPGPREGRARRAPGRRARRLHPARARPRAAGRHRAAHRRVRHRLAGRGVQHRLGPELEQLRARHDRLHARGRGRRRVAPDQPHRARQGARRGPLAAAGGDAAGPRAVGRHRRDRVAVRRPRPAVPRHHQRVAHVPGRRRHPRVEPVRRVRLPRRHRLQPGVAEPAPVRDRRRLRRRAVPPRRAALDGRARDLGPDGAVPVQGDRARQLRLPHARPGLRQHGRPRDAPRPAVRLARGHRAVRRADRDHALLVARRERRDGGRAGAVLGLRAQRRGHAARRPQPPQRGVRGRPRGVRGPLGAAGAHRRRDLRARPAGRRPRGRRPRARARRAARLPQRPGDADRADRHDRPRDGLRHDRHRARLRAREVQEAGRRRLLQDGQRVGAAGAREPRLHAAAGRRHRAVLRRLRHARGLPAPGAREAAPARLHRRLHRRPRRRDARGVRRAVRVHAVHRHRRGLHRAPRHRSRGPAAARLRPAVGDRLHAGRDRRGEPVRLRHDDRRGCPAPARPSTCRCSTAPTSAAGSARGPSARSPTSR